MAKYNRRLRFGLFYALVTLFFVEVFFRLLFIFSNLNINAFIKNSMYTADPLLGYALKPGFSMHHRHQVVKINTSGFRADEIDETSNLVFCLGGSSTFGYFNSQNETWPHLLDGLIQKEMNNWQFINAGVPGYNSWQGSTRTLTELVHFHPKLIIVSHVWNDLKYFSHPADWKNFRDDKIFNVYVKPGLIERNYYTYIMFNAMYHKLFGNITPGGEAKFQNKKGQIKLNAEAFQFYAGNLERLLDEAKNRGIRIILMDELYLRGKANTLDISEEEVDVLFAKSDKILRKMSEKYKVPYIRLNEKIAVSEDIMDDHIHPNSKGNLLIAEEIKTVLRNILFTSHEGK